MTSEQKIQEFLLLSGLEQKNYEEIAQQLEVERNVLTLWEKENKMKYKEISEIRKIYLRKKFNEIGIRCFYEWYCKQERKCFYCEITETKINDLLSKGKINTKRLKTRGKKLEIERRKPELGYNDIQNLTLCCYWCNNAKSDEFSEEEFIRYIAPCIKKIWQERLFGLRTPYLKKS
jgi:hypothetical protein